MGFRMLSFLYHNKGWETHLPYCLVLDRLQTEFDGKTMAVRIPRDKTTIPLGDCLQLVQLEQPSGEE